MSRAYFENMPLLAQPQQSRPNGGIFCCGMVCMGACMAVVMLVQAGLHAVGLYAADQASPCLLEHGWLPLWLQLSCGVSLGWVAVVAAFGAYILYASTDSAMPSFGALVTGGCGLCLIGTTLAIFRVTMAVLGTIQLVAAYGPCYQTDFFTLVMACIIDALLYAGICSACFGV